MSVKRPLEQRFFEKVDTENSASICNGSRCHEWRGAIMPGGYGQIRNDGSAKYAHRVAWELANGPITNGLYVLHRCDNRRCVNPDHLFLGTFYDNMADMTAKRRQAHGARQTRHAKLTDDDIREIRKSSELQADLAKRFNVTQPTIRNSVGKHLAIC